MQTSLSEYRQLVNRGVGLHCLSVRSTRPTRYPAVQWGAPSPQAPGETSCAFVDRHGSRTPQLRDEHCNRKSS
jgi:hypothetical protein